MPQPVTRRSLLGGVLLPLITLAIAAAPASAQVPSTCGNIATSFDAPIASGTITPTVPSVCFSIDGAADGGIVAVRLELATGDTPLRWELRDGDEQVLCVGFTSDENPACVLRGAAGWKLVILVRDMDAPRVTTTFATTVRRIDSTAGCDELDTPTAWSFDNPPIAGSISSPLDVRCYTFRRGSSDPDDTLRIRLAMTSGDLFPPRWVIYTHTGRAVGCGPPSPGYTQCVLRNPGRFALVVSGYGTSAGSFALGLSRMSARAGCTSVNSSFSSGSLADSIEWPGDIDCYELTGGSVDDRVRITVDKAAAEWTLVDGDGRPVCSSGSGLKADCRLTGTSGWAVLVENWSGPQPRPNIAPFPYGLSIRKLNEPVGCTDIGAPSSWSFARAPLSDAMQGGVIPKCFSFERIAGSPDDVVWFRTGRTSGPLEPTWRVYDPQGTLVCSGANEGYLPCELRASGRYAVLIEDAEAAAGGGFYLDAYRGSAPAGCADGPATDFAATPINGEISAAGDVDCLSLENLHRGDRVDVRVSDGGWTIIDGAGQLNCPGSRAPVQCQLVGAEGWALLIYGDGPAFDYSVAVRRLNDPAGCTPAGDPEVWSFTSAPIVGLVGAVRTPRCFTFRRAVDEADGTYLLRAVRSSGTIDPTWRIYDSQGDVACDDELSNVCHLQGAGTHTIVVGDLFSSSTGGTGTGGFTLTADRISRPEGCTDVRSVTTRIPRTAGWLERSGEVDCYRLPTADGDMIVFQLSGIGKRLSLYEPNGDLLCQGSTSLSCNVKGDEPVLALVDAQDGVATGSYAFDAECVNKPCGDTTVVSVTPNAIGTGNQATVLLSGRNLGRLQSVRFVREGATVNGTLEAAEAGAPTRWLRLDTRSAPPGDYELEAGMSDGSTRRLGVPLSIASAEHPAVRLDLVGRSAFRPGVSSTVVVQATNTGNVDARGVSLILGGLPGGSTLTLEGGVTELSGDAAHPRLQTKPFDMATGSVLTDQGLVAPFSIPLVPAGSSVQIRFTLTIPTDTDFDLRVLGGECLDHAAPDTAEHCADGLIRAIAEAGGNPPPEPTCMDLARNLAENAVFSAGTSAPPLSWGSALSWGLGAADCTPGFMPAAFAGNALELAGTIWAGRDTGYRCAGYFTESTLHERATALSAPNEIIGPAGAQQGRYITGDGEQAYHVLFENPPSATAPVEHVVVVNDLDMTRFDSTTLRFRSVRFGDTVLELPRPVSDIDEWLDLRPRIKLNVHVTAAVSAAGRVRWELQAFNPRALGPPEVPLLAPNDDTHRGEGAVSYTVRLKEVHGGEQVSNPASVAFDTNEPVDTPIWSNVIDRSPPDVTLSSRAADEPGKAAITWGGSDAGAGVARWDITVSKDGGPSRPWHTERAAGSVIFAAADSGMYTFSATAHDGANNASRPVESAVALVVPTAGGAAGGGGTGGSGSNDGRAIALPTISKRGHAKLVRRGSRLVVRTGQRMTCPPDGPAPCAVTARLTAKPLKATRHSKTIVVGRARLTVGAGKSVTIRVTLNARGRALARRLKRLRLTAVVTLQRGPAEARAEPKRFTVRVPPPRTHH